VNWLRRILLARRLYKVEAGAELRVRISVADEQGQPLAHTDVSVEGPSPSVARLHLGQTDRAGRLDSTGTLNWSYDATDITKPPPLRFTLLVQHHGFHTHKSSFVLQQLPLAAETYELDAGSVTLRV
jgi:hypothetical protein